MASVEGQVVGYRKQGRTSVVTIERPEARNAVNPAVAQAIEAAIDRLEADDEVLVGVLTGTGTVFSAGADLKTIAAGGFADLVTPRGGFAGITRRVRTKPVIAAVDGAALAGGTEIVLACDLVVASTAASFGIPEVKRSLIAAAGGLFRLPRALPLAVAMEMAMTGDQIPAERAYVLGMVNALVEPGTALDAALELAARIAGNAPVAVRESRRVVMAAVGEDDERLWGETAASLSRVMSTEDFAEGPKAFVEKRPPVWKGR